MFYNVPVSLILHQPPKYFFLNLKLKFALRVKWLESIASQEGKSEVAVDRFNENGTVLKDI